MIIPTIGRVVWYYEQGSRPSQQPLAAIVTDVFGDRCVNLAIFQPNGVPMSHPPTSVSLVQEKDMVPLCIDGTHARHCRWMPYQIQQSKKHEAESALDDARKQG